MIHTSMNARIALASIGIVTAVLVATNFQLPPYAPYRDGSQGGANDTPPYPLVGNTSLGTSDPNATPETQALFQNLMDLRGKGLIFGHQLTSYSGQSWVDIVGTDDRSDVQIAVGDYPGMYGINLGRDYIVGEGMDIVKEHVLNGYRRGAVITFHMTMPNPVTLGDAKDPTGEPMKNLLPGGSGNENFLKILDDIADLANSLTYNGHKIPVIFRPWHEMSGPWNWWGDPHCTTEEYIAGWRYMVDYLRNEKGVHNFLYAYAPAAVSDSPTGGYERYPGDEYVDVAGMDRYGGDTPGSPYSRKIVADARFVVNFAQSHNKIPAITETGVGNGIQNSNTDYWFDGILLDPIKADPVARNVVYFLTWTNNPNSYWVPLQGQQNYDSFVRFYNDSYTLFSRDLPNMYE